MQTPPDTVHARLAQHADRRPDAVALESAGRPPLTYAGLRGLVDSSVDVLNRAGAGRGDCVAIVLPHTPELATACLAVSACAAAAPLNPDYRETEFDFQFDSLAPKLVILPTGRTSAARAVAQARGIPIVELTAVEGAATGTFRLTPPTGVGAVREGGHLRADDVALVLHTSGTTARPKKVPLTQGNLLASVGNLVSSLGLGAGDRVLHVLPMFHVGGIVDVLAAPLVAGGSVVCTSGYSEPEFYRSLETFRPTWTQCVPAMLRELADNAEKHRTTIERSSLRFIRSVSAALPVALLSEVEAAFRVPVVEIYGMTETAGLIASNPFPNGVRKPGSVGIAAGAAIAVVDGTGAAVPTGTRGEVVVKGDNVMRGYAGGEEANAATRYGEWFRTGDEGCLDGDGYLFLTGRIKEIINRGGEKISPPEVDDVLLSHPAVAEAATFALPHPTLGEEVAAAVVLRPGATVAKHELVAYAKSRLAYFKVPHVVHFLQAIPRTAGGKLQRNRLAETLGLAYATSGEQRSAYVAPQTPVARALAAMWERALGIDRLGVDDDFFALGGDSLKAASFVNQIQQSWGDAVYVTAVFDAPTVGRFEAYLRASYPDLVARMSGEVAESATAARRGIDAEALRRFRQAIAPTLGAPLALAAKNPPAILVLSPPRSGSTLLRAMLGGHPRLFAPPELDLLAFDTLADRKAWFTGPQRCRLEGNTRALMQVRGMSLAEAEALMAELEASRTPVHEYVRRLQGWMGDRTLVDATPCYASRIETLERAEATFRDARYVHLVRHPCGVIRSFEEAKLGELWYPRLVGTAEAKRTPCPWPAQAFSELLWTTLHRNVLAFLEGIPGERQCRVTFEDLVRDPERTIRSLCGFVGVDFEPAMLEPQRDPCERMTDGVPPGSRMIGDVTFPSQRSIDASVADRWKQACDDDFLSDDTREVALALGCDAPEASPGEREVFEL
ncbi:MAG: AMP-binding protein [Betaproteobacteria bacterium]|nr:AMP-binding protein [Betaproteobacteria bacterium]